MHTREVVARYFPQVSGIELRLDGRGDLSGRCRIDGLRLCGSSFGGCSIEESRRTTMS